MSRYSPYGYCDPVGSSQAPPTGYTHQNTTNAPSYPSAAAPSGYGGGQQGYGSSGYGAQSQGSGAQNITSPNHAAAALSSLGGQDYNQTSHRGSTGQYDDPQWYGSSAPSNDGGSNVQRPKLSAAYQNAPASVGSNHRHQSHTNQAAPNSPRKYNSPLHAVQDQQRGHQNQASRGSNRQPSPQMADAVLYAQQNRPPTVLVEPSPATVDPSQVYDNRAELERKARFDAERSKGVEVEQAAKNAEEDRLAAERRELEQLSQEATESAEAAKKKEQQQRKKEQRRKAREEKRRSKSAATTLQQMASMVPNNAAAEAGGDEEAEMRAMFRKMREFNSKNPAMLVKLWEEERKQHSASQSPQAEKSTPAPAPKSTHSRQPAAQAQPRSAAQPAKVPSQVAAVQQAKTIVGSQARPQSTPSRPGSTSTTSLWPPHKKGALADATAKWLMGLPQNAGGTVGQQAVLSILNSNPSYVQLCESLENLGMKFERSALARELLKAVPDGLRTQQKSSTLSVANESDIPMRATSKEAAQTSRQTPQSPAGRPRAPSGSDTVSYSAPLSLSDAAMEVNEMHKSTSQVGGHVQPPQQSPYPSQSQTMTNGSRPPSQVRAASQSQPPEVKPEVQPEEPPRPPADKEEAARKRTFGDLVDLTMDDESDEEGPPPKKTLQLPSPVTIPSNGASIQQHDPLAYLAQQPYQQPYKPFNHQPKHQIPGPGITQPPQRPHQVLPSNQQAPGAQPQPAQQVSQKPKGPSAEQLQGSRMRGRMLVEPIMRDRVARKSKYDSSTIARDVLIATGRHPDMRGLNAHLNSMQKLLGHHGGEVETTGTKCDLSTVRWDIIDPAPPKESEKPAEVQSGAVSHASSPDPLAAPPDRLPATVDYEAPFMSTSQMPPGASKEKKKRGRKPRALMPGGLGAGAGSPNPPARVTSTSLNPTPGSPVDPALLAQANDMAASGAPVGYSAFRQIGPDGQVIKKKGRPVGWRKSVHSREAQGLEPRAKKEGTGTGTGKRLGRPPKTAKEKTLVEPRWQTFHCEWQGCKAELQNLETLKKHLLKVHGREIESGRGYQCLWKECDRRPGEGGGFQELEDWMGHVDKAHLQPIAWKQGDGPRGGSLGDSPSFRRGSGSPAYLLDAHGRPVTPVIEPTPPPSDLTLPNPPDPAGTATAAQLPLHPAPAAPDEAPSKRIGRPPKDGMPKLERDAGAELRKLEEHKRLVGALMERQGCVLGSAERRATFLGDEGFEDVVDATTGEFAVDEGVWD